MKDYADVRARLHTARDLVRDTLAKDEEPSKKAERVLCMLAGAWAHGRGWSSPRLGPGHVTEEVDAQDISAFLQGYCIGYAVEATHHVVAPEAHETRGGMLRKLWRKVFP